ncbi:MAG: AAA family ATPase [Verrucomicrobiaceae bacterium]|nr:AAA family ATPase [Verrucomicrobiaceae bacterium]
MVSLITLVVTSQKGGVGKTTVAINLAHSLACRGWQTLLVDTDPQNSVGLSLSEKTRRCPGYYDFLHYECDVDELIIPTRLPELHLITAGLTETFFKLETDTSHYAGAVARMLGQLDGLNYDVVVLDTAAGLMGHTRELVRQADFALLPQQSEPLGVRSIIQLLEGIARLREEEQAIVEVAGILLTMVDPHGEESLQVACDLRMLVPGDTLLRTSIPREQDFVRASAHGVPVALLYQKLPPAALVFDQLAAELEPRLTLQKVAYGEREFTRLMD